MLCNELSLAFQRVNGGLETQVFQHGNVCARAESACSNQPSGGANMSSRSQLFSLLGFVVALSVFTSTPVSAGGGAIGMVARTTDSSIGAHATRA